MPNLHFVLLKHIFNSLCFILGLLKFEFVLSAEGELLVKLLLEITFAIRTHGADLLYISYHLVHIVLVLLIHSTLLLKLLLQNSDLALKLADFKVILV